MAQTTLGDVLSYLRGAWAAQEARDLTDGQLLERFLADGDETAFAALVQRHGPLVLGICRRLAGDWHSAEDMYQATFLVLIRRAASIRKKVSLASWLCAVARRVALRARAQNAARRKRERQATLMPRGEPLDDATWEQLRSVLDEEIGRLPEKYRAPIILCYLAGKSHDQAARELGWPKSSLTSRLGRGRELLREHLVSRGIALSAAALATALSEKALGAPVPARLIINTVKAAMCFAAGKTISAAWVSARAIALAEEALRGPLGVKGTLLLVVAALGLGVSGVGLAGYGGLGSGAAVVPVSAKASRVSAAAVPRDSDARRASGQGNVEKTAGSTDQYGDAMPAGVVERLGTERFRHPFASWVGFVGEGKILASVGHETGIYLWDANTGRPLHQLPLGPWALSPDGKLLITANYHKANAAINLSSIDVSTGREVLQFEDVAGLFLSFIAVSPDGKTVAAGGRVNGTSTLIQWDIVTGKEARRLEVIGEPVTPPIPFPFRFFAFSPDWKVMASADGGKSILFLDLTTGKTLRRFDAPGKVQSIAFSPNGKTFAATSFKSGITLWEVQSGKQVHQLNQAGLPNTIAFSPDGKLLAGPDEGGRILSLWDCNTMKEIRRVEAKTPLFASVAFSPDSKTIASVGSGAVIRRWDTATGQEIDPPSGHTGPVNSMAFAPGGKTLYSFGHDQKALEWDLETLRLLRDGLDDSVGPTEKGWAWDVIARSPDGKVAALAGFALEGDEIETGIRLWDVALRKQILVLNGHRDWVQSGRFSPDGRYLASVSSDGTRLWEIATGKELVHVEVAMGMAFSPDSKLAAYAGRGTLYLFDIAARKDVQRWETKDLPQVLRSPYDGLRLGLVFSPDRSLLASFGSNSVCVWATDTAKLVCKIAAPDGDGLLRADALALRVRLMRMNVVPVPLLSSPQMISCVFSPTGRVVAIGTIDNRRLNSGAMDLCVKIHLLELLSGEEISQFESPQRDIGSLAFSPDGRTLASGGADSTILLWDLTGQARGAKLKSSFLSPEELNGLWSDLTGSAALADRAIWKLALAPQQSVSWLKQRFFVVAVPPDQIAKLIAELDSKQYAVREKAIQALRASAETAEVAIRKALAADPSPSLEMRMRLESILKTLPTDLLSKLRAVEALERAGTPEARQLLKALVDGAANPQVADAAGAALKRLAARP